MNRQTVIFIGLALLVGFLFYQSQNSAEQAENPLTITDERMDIDDAMDKHDDTDSMEAEDAMIDKKTEDAMEEKPATDGPVVQNIENQTFTSYTNRAVGYTIERPDTWYWQHFFVTELETFPSTNDIVAIDRAPLPDVVSIYNAAIIIDVKTGEVTTPSGTKTDVSIAGKSAARYETNSSGTTILVYHIPVTNDTTLRMIYSGTTDDTKQQAIFEHIVQSLTF